MKYVSLLFAFVFVSAFTSAQWTVTNFNTATDVSKIKFFGATDVWLACDTGVFRSTNNGTSFSQNGLYYPAGNIYIGSFLNDVAVINSTTAIGAGLFYLGNDEMIIRTTNSAANWDTVQHTFFTFLAQFHAADFPTASVGYVAGWQGRIFRSTNGGLSWSGVYSNSPISLYDIAMTSANEGAAVGDNGIYYTSNGTSWSQVLNIAGSNFNSISFNGSTGYAGGSSSSGDLYKSTNNGATWSVINFPYGDINGVHTISTDTIVVVTQTTAYKSCNSGLYWEEFVLPQLPSGSHWFKDIAFRGNEGYIACSDGVLLKTSNGGGATKPIVSYTLPPTALCQNMNYNFTNTSPAVYSYQWKIDGVTVSTNYSLNITLADSGAHTITLIAFNGSLYDTLTSNLFVQPFDFIQPISFNVDTICPGSSGMISVFNTNTSYQYQLRNGFTNIGAPVFGNGSTINFSVTPSQTATYNIKTYGSNPCYTDSLITIITQVVFPDKFLPVVVGDSLICSGKEFYHVDIQNTQTGVLYKLRDGGTKIDSAYGNGGTVTLSTPVLYKAFGTSHTYNVQASLNSGCTATMRFINVAVDTVIPKFNVVNPNSYPGDSIELQGYLSTADYYQWTFPAQANIQISTLQVPTISINTPGTYNIKLITTNNEGCADSLTSKVYIMSPAATGTTNFCGNTTVLPNTLTPYDSYLDKDKNLYMTGSYSGTSAQDWHYFALKMDSLGNLLWYKPAMNYSSEQSSGQGLAVDDFGNVYVSGFFRGTKIYLDSALITGDGITNQKGFLIKYDSNGNIKWIIKGVRQINSGLGMWFSDVAVDSTNRIYFTGEHENGVFTFPDNSTFTATGDSTTAFLMSVDTAGLNYNYTTFGSVSGGRTTGVYISFATNPRLELLANNDLLITSCFSDSSNNMHTQFGAFNFTDTTNVVYAGIYNSSVGFKKVIRGPSGNIWQMREAIADANNNIYMIGTVSRNLEFKNVFYKPDAAFSGSTLYYPNHSFVAKLDSAGNSGWINYSRFSNITDIAVSSNNELMFTAFIDSNGFFGNQNAIPQSIATIGKSDGVIGKYDANGNIVFANKQGTQNHDVAYNIALDDCDNMIVATSTNRTNGSGWPDPSYYYAYGNFAVEYFSKDNSCYHDGACNTVAIDTLNDDAALLKVWLPKTLTAFANVPVSVKLKSFGIDTLKTAQIIVEVNGVIQLIYNWNGALTKYHNVDSIAIGQLNFASAGIQYIKAYVQLPNGNAEVNNANDTVYTTIDVCAPLAGTYTIGAGGNFSSFTDATNHLKECGLSSHVYFDVLPGVYTDRIFLTNIPSSVTDSIVFRSASQDSSSVILQWGGGYPYSNALVEINNTDYITFYQMTIRNLDIDKPVNMNIRTRNGCNHLNFWNCVIERFDPDTMATHYLFTQSGSQDDYLNIQHNLFFQGGRAIDLNGTNSFDCVVKHNRFINQTLSAILTLGLVNPEVTDNYIESNFHVTNAYFGIAISAVNSKFTLTRNKIVVYGGDAHGIAVGGSYTSLNPGLVSNNMVSLFNSVNGTLGLQLGTGSNYINIYNNSFYISGTSKTSAGIYGYSVTATNVDFKNNIFHMADSGYVMWFSQFLNQNINLDYNAYYTNNTKIIRNDTIQGIQYFTSLPQWSLFSGTDAHSKFHAANFNSSTDLHIVNDVDIDNAGTPLVSVTDDYDLDQRDPVTPDIGCDEFVGNPNLVNVWPGDANNNLLVDNYDIIPLAFYNNQTGNARASVSNVFAPQQALKWNGLQFNGSDKVYADCNGSGVINNADTLAVKLNYNQTHLLALDGQKRRPKYILQTSMTGPDLYFVINDSIYTPGENVSIEVWTGTAALPVNNLMAIGFQMSIDPQLIEPGTYQCNLSNNWMCGVSNCFTFSNPDESTGQCDATIAKSDGVPVSGYGKIANITFTVNNSIAVNINQQLNLLNYFAADSSGDSILFNVIADSILAGNSVGINEIKTDNFSIFPNPVTDEVFIQAKSFLQEATIKIYDVTGRIVMQKNISSTQNQIRLNTSKLSPANYILEVVSNNNVWREKFVKW